MTGLPWLFRKTGNVRKLIATLYLVTAYLSIPAQGFAQKQAVFIDSIRFVNGDFSVDFHVDELFDEAVTDGLERGFTVGITYQIELWKVRNNWFDQLLTRQVLQYKTGYNKFDRRYFWRSESGEFGPESLVSSSFEKIKQKCSVHKGIVLAEKDEFDVKDRYYVVITGILEPLSVENMDEMRKWLGGEVTGLELKENPEDSPKKLTGRFLTFIKNITGFGDRHYAGRSGDFSVTETGTIRYRNR